MKHVTCNFILKSISSQSRHNVVEILTIPLQHFMWRTEAGKLRMSTKECNTHVQKTWRKITLQCTTKTTNLIHFQFV